MPNSMGYLRVRIPRLLWASSPTYESFWPIPTITPLCLGRPTMQGNATRGASSPAKPALHIPEPLSTTKAATSSSAILIQSGNAACESSFQSESSTCVVTIRQSKGLKSVLNYFWYSFVTVPSDWLVQNMWHKLEPNRSFCYRCVCVPEYALLFLFCLKA